MEQIERISYMEQLFDFVQEAMKELPENSNKLVEIQDAIKLLSSYYGSDEWKQDFVDDEAGLLPQELKRGVLSEDGIWNLLVEWNDFKKLENHPSQPSAFTAMED